MTYPGKAPWETRKTEENLTRRSEAKLKLATVNVETMVQGKAKVKETIRRRQVNAVALQEMGYKNKQARRFGFEYKL